MVLDQYLKSIDDINQQIGELFKTDYSPSTLSKAQELLEQKKERIKAIQGAIYIKISHKSKPEDLKKIAEEINKIKKDDVFDTNASEYSLMHDILEWSFGKERVKELATIYTNYYGYGDVNISINNNGDNRSLAYIVGRHEANEKGHPLIVTQATPIPLNIRTTELIQECLTPIGRGYNKMGYSKDEADGIAEKLSEIMEHRNYEGINKFYQTIDEFHDMLNRIKPNAEEEEFIPENSTEIYSLYANLQNLEAKYFNYYKKDCANYQRFHWAKFQYPIKDQNKHYDKMNPVLSPHRNAISKEKLKENIITTYIECLKEQGLIDENDCVNDNEIKQSLKNKENGAQTETEKEKYKRLSNLYEVFEDDELYNNFTLFQDLINVSFNEYKYQMNKKFDLGPGMGWFNNPYFRPIEDRPGVIDKLVLNMEFGSIFADKLKEKGIGNLISKSNIYSEISGKYVNIVNDIVRVFNLKTDEGYNLPLVSENSYDHDVKYYLRDISNDYETLKQFQSKIKNVYQSEQEFDQNHSKNEIDDNMYLAQDTPFKQVFDLQSDDKHIRELADCLNTSNTFQADTPKNK